MALRLTVVTPARPVVDAEVDSVIAPGAEGQFGVLPAHESYLAPLQAGLVQWVEGGSANSIEITGGFAEVGEERVTILADGTDIDDDEAE
jgi:F-type H+-transporting ATPase subunit epsilon